jgi:hypothetical protein
VAAVTLAACGSSSSASTTSTTSAKSAGGGRTGSGAAGGARTRPGTSGTIAAITGTSLEVQNPTSGQTTVTYTSTTTFDQTVSAAASGVTVGSCISAFGKPTSTSSTGKSAFGGPVTATTVTISQPVSGSCTTGFGGGGFGGGGAGRPGGFSGGGSGGSDRAPGGAAGRFRGGAGGQFGAASGQVTAVSGSTATVGEVNPSTKATSSVVITLTASTTYTERTSATSSDLAVGKCATAIGTADSTGAVTARSISISQPVSGSCTTGFGGFGRGGGGAPGQGGPTGA